MSESRYQSPISPGRSWYEDSCGNRPQYEPLRGDITCDVAIVGGGFCGLSAALNLANAGTDVVLVEAHRLGDGASGRNGGQMGSGQRSSVLELEKELGFDRAKALWDLAEAAKKSLRGTADEHGFEIDYLTGQLSVMHKQRYEAEARNEVAALNERYGYSAISYLDREAMAQALGSDVYFGGARDTGTGHIHPMKYVIGLARAAHKAGARLAERSPVKSVRRAGSVVVEGEGFSVSAERCLVATNGYHDDLRRELGRHILPLQSFIGATEPLGHNSPVLPGREAVDDSRFVVRYLRKTADDRLLFGGREIYGRATPGDIKTAIRRQIAEIYPDLRDVPITHAWGGNVGITMPRMPYVRELEPGLWAAGGFSGHGVMMANYTGRLIAEQMLGQSDTIRLLRELKIPAFPGGRFLREPLKVLALTWYSLLDRI